MKPMGGKMLATVFRALNDVALLLKCIIFFELYYIIISLNQNHAAREGLLSPCCR